MKTKRTLLKDRMILKRLVESYGKKDVLDFVKHLNESVTGSRYTSLQLANLADMYFENDDNTLYEVAERIAKPWNDALSRVSLEPGIGISEDLIGEKCGLKGPSIYKHFKGKEEILDILIWE